MNVTRTLLVLLFLWIGTALPATASKNEKAATSLAKRIIPEVADKIRFEQLSENEKKDFFELESLEGKIVIRGNSANSMAVGLNHYLKYYCKTSILEYLNDPVELWMHFLPFHRRSELRLVWTIASS